MITLYSYPELFGVADNNGYGRSHRVRKKRTMPSAIAAKRRNRRAVIIGGSMSGLFAAAFLRQKGWEAEVYERSTVELVGRGAGITPIRNCWECAPDLREPRRLALGSVCEPGTLRAGDDVRTTCAPSRDGDSALSKSGRRAPLPGLPLPSPRRS